MSTASTSPTGFSPPTRGRPFRWGLLLALLGIMAAGTVVLAQSGGGYDLTWHVLDGGGGRITDGPVAYSMNSSFGQPSTVYTSVDAGNSYVLCNGYWSCSYAPTAVKLTAFAATRAGADILVTWETATEYNNAGFNLYRQAGPNGPTVQLNEDLIPSAAPGGDQGASYAFLDPTVEAGIAYLYTLEDVDTSGTRTSHGPVGALAPYVVCLPLMEW